MPPYHIAGMAAMLSSLYAGRRIMYLPAFDAAEWVATAAAEQVTHAMVVPTMLGRILEAIEEPGAELPHLRHLSYGGGRMPLELVERALRDLPQVDLVNAYGLTETSSTIALLSPDDHREAFASDDPAVRARLGSVGRPLPSLEVEIRDADEPVLGPGEQGEIWVRGEQVAGEYVGNTVLTADGWFRTRDAGWLDERRLPLRRGPARRRDRPRRRRTSRPARSRTSSWPTRPWPRRPSSASPTPSGARRWPRSWCCTRGRTATEAELQTWVRERLRSTKMPGVIEFRHELPYSPTGKLLRRVLREELSEAGPSGAGVPAS